MDGARKIFDTRGWSLSVYAAGQCHLTSGARSLKCSATVFGITSQISGRAPAVRGHRAFWSGSFLIWQYARSGWALLDAPFPEVPHHGPKRVPPIEREAVKIADHVRYGAATPPLVFPVQLTGLPSQWRVSSVFYVPDAGVLQATRFALGTGTPDLGADGGLEYQKNLPYFENLGPATSHSSCYRYSYLGSDFSDKPKVKTINGHQVVVTNLDRGTIRQGPVRRSRRRPVGLYLASSACTPLNLTTLFRDHPRLLGANPANWTRKPIG